ncbi:MAG: HAD-IIB family hydrolase [Ruminiclostridium sp.]|nr:HAD-IIB family hydrolase [Ruminiclostridium sp.]
MTLYISDLDGTLLNSSKKIKPRSVDMLNDMIYNGVMFTYCTARRINSSGPIMKDVNIQLPVALMNGVFIYDSKKNEYLRKNFPSASSVEMLREAVIRLNERPMIHSVINDEIRNSYLVGSKNLNSYVEERKNDKSMRPVESYEELFKGEVFYAVFINPVNKDELDKIFIPENGFSHTYYKDVYHDDEYWYEVYSVTASKANAVMQLKEITGADEIVCFGDSDNDLPMFSVADRSYAVENAAPEVKNAADGVIASNEEMGVPLFIEKEVFERFDYNRPENDIPDEKRFTAAVEKALARERSTIGTLNEKTIHNALKCYYCDEISHEARIGDFYADAAGENGIIEIQTANFLKLNKKLSKMLRVCHVTVVYPFEKLVHNFSVNEQTGEVISSSNKTNNSYSKFFLELYRIKAFLTNPNLTICMAQLEINKKTYYKDNRRIRYKGIPREKIPVRYIKEIRLDNKEDYMQFIPDGLPEQFTKKDLGKLCRTTDPSIMLEILEYVGVVKRVGKKGNAILYSTDK